MTERAPRYLTSDEKDFIRTNYGKMSYKEMAEILHPRTASSIKTWCRKGILNKVDIGEKLNIHQVVVSSIILGKITPMSDGLYRAKVHFKTPVMDAEDAA